MNAPWPSNKRGAGDTPRDIFSAFVCDDASAEALKAAVLDLGWQPDRIYKGGLQNAVQTLSVSASPEILLVDLSQTDDPLSQINALAEVCEPGTIVIAIGDINDVRLYRELLASGIHDYSLKPISVEGIRESLHNAQAILLAPKTPAHEPEPTNSVVAVMGTRGGVGTSTIAGSIAWVSAEILKKNTALLDLDIHFGVGALSFDLEPGRGLTDALENPSRIDSLFIERAIVKASNNLSVLSAEAPINAPLLTDGSALLHLQEQMAQAYEALVIDLPRMLAVQNPHLVAELKEIIVVTDLTLAAARDTIRVLGFLNTHAPAAKIRIVANKFPGQNATEVSRKDFEASIERSIDVLLPLDAKGAMAAAQQGKSLVQAAQGTKLSNDIISLARTVLTSSAADAEPEEQSVFTKILNLKSLLSPKSK